MSYKPCIFGGWYFFLSVQKQLLIQGDIFDSLKKVYACKRLYAKWVKFRAESSLCVGIKLASFLYLVEGRFDWEILGSKST